MTSRTERTRAALLDSALGLFEGQGYDATTAAEVAAAAGVSEMTFFRHFPTKASLLLDDPYDPLIAAAVAAGSGRAPLVHRVAHALRSTLPELPPAEAGQMRRRLRVAAATPSLAAALHANTVGTADAVVRELVADGASPLDAKVAAAACLSGVTEGLLRWARDDDSTSLTEAVSSALDVVEGLR